MLIWVARLCVARLLLLGRLGVLIRVKAPHLGDVIRVELAHESHQELVKTRGMLCSKVWFPWMDSLVDSIARHSLSSCHAQAFTWTRWLLWPMNHGKYVSNDFCEVAGHYDLAVIDDHSRFPGIEVVHPTSAKAVIPKAEEYRGRNWHNVRRMFFYDGVLYFGWPNQPPAGTVWILHRTTVFYVA